ncbi:ORF122 [Agrotis segetum granulovirus]|uniref:ORF122 n=1 Tax=Agrotis segetum granulosis virus TaxID=10464 RepID=Q6QXI2_GVAS|nr:hypothetical protein AsGV138 [Agrotis segetum granulovirus]AAS82616.1 ORF122 [Agrotis segetum granulovirus]AHN92174.1 hypothetical protein AsGV135 [Agrotis segetum granulovirus]AKN63411.1 hypothetical protein AsGV138 [Agrotis segetum granulovirus]
MFVLTVKEKDITKRGIEQIIFDQFPSMECAVCYDIIDEKNKGCVYITCDGKADLEHIFCADCAKKFRRQDPYKRPIAFKFEFPFVNDEAAKSFVRLSKRFVLNEGNEEKIKLFENNVKRCSEERYTDIEYDFDLKL